jgi:hypothetical protein
LELYRYLSDVNLNFRPPMPKPKTTGNQNWTLKNQNTTIGIDQTSNSKSDQDKSSILLQSSTRSNASHQASFNYNHMTITKSTEFD